MSISITPHLNFNGHARAALTFYHSVFAGEITLISYGEAGAAPMAPAPEHILWGQVSNDQGFRIMAYDVQTDRAWHPGENAMYVVLGAETPAEATDYWGKLADGATIMQPLSPAPWAPLYGMLKDRFGVVWVVSVAGAPR